MNIKSISIISLLLAITFVGNALLNAQKTKPTNPFTVGNPLTTDSWWVDRCNSLNARIKQGKVDYIFIGDSITQGWEIAGKQAWDKNFGPKNAVNLGINGDETQSVIWRLENGNIKGISPKVAVLMIGTNNFHFYVDPCSDPVDVAEGVAAIVKLLRTKLPDTKVLVYGIFPRGPIPTERRNKIFQTNQFINKLDDGKNVFFRDIGYLLIDNKGNLPADIMPDFLHLSPKGYEIWAKALNKHLAEIK